MKILHVTIGSRSPSYMRARQPFISGETVWLASRRTPLGVSRVVRLGYGDSGDASRFFPTFRYEAKAPATERPRVNGTAHPTVKPLDLMRWLVRLLTPPGGVVLDPFAGSGTTLLAAVDEDRRAIGVELEERYCEIIAKRLTQGALDLGI